jgi:predicted amidohydrolase
MSRHLTIAAVHFTNKGEGGSTPFPDDAYDQWRLAEERLDGGEVDLVVACEGMESEGQRMEEAEDIRQPGRMLQTYAATAQRNRCTVVGSVKLREEGAIYNAQVMFGPDGAVLGRYRKCFLTGGELDSGMSRGPGAEVVVTPAGRIGGAICFDLNFPELRTAYARLTPDIIAFSSMYHGGHMQQSWAYETRAFFVGACKDALSEIRDPLGRVLASANGYSQVAVARVNLHRVIVHLDRNQDLFPGLRRRFGPGIRIEAAADLGVALISCEAGDLTLADLMEAFPLQPLDPYLDLARRA